MLDIIRESGFAAWVSLLIFVAGLAALITYGRRKGRIGSTGAAWAAAVLASGALGVGTGQRMVDRYVQNLAETDLAGRVMAVSIGTREAAANMLFSGMLAMIVLLVAGVLALVSARRERPA